LEKKAKAPLPSVRSFFIVPQKYSKDAYPVEKIGETGSVAERLTET